MSDLRGESPALALELLYILHHDFVAKTVLIGDPVGQLEVAWRERARPADSNRRSGLALRSGLSRYWIT